MWGSCGRDLDRKSPLLLEKEFTAKTCCPLLEVCGGSTEDPLPVARSWRRTVVGTAG